MRSNFNVLLVIVALASVVYADRKRLTLLRLFSLVLKEDLSGSAAVAVELEN